MASIKKLGIRKRIALVAHDHKKKDLMEWVAHNREVLSKHELFATGTTGKMIEESMDRPVKKLMSGPMGGDQQIGAMIANGEIDMMFFFLGSHGSTTTRQRRKSLTAFMCIVEYSDGMRQGNSRFPYHITLYAPGIRIAITRLQ